MPTIVGSVIVADETDSAVYTTPSFTPVAGDCCLMIIATKGAGSITIPNCQFLNSVAGLPAWSSIYQGRQGANSWIGALITEDFETAVARTVQITFPSIITGFLAQVVFIRGLNRPGRGAVRSAAIGEIQTAGGTPNLTMPQAMLSDSSVIVGLTNATNPATVTPPAGFTEILDTGLVNPTSGFEVATRNSGQTGTTITWGSTSATADGVIAVELSSRAVTADDGQRLEAGWGGLQ